MADPAWSAYFQETQPGNPARVSSLKIQLNPSELGMVTAHLLAAKAAGEAGAEAVPVNLVRAGERIRIGPFDVEYF